MSERVANLRAGPPASRGSLGESKPADPTSQEVADAVKGKVLEQLKSSKTVQKEYTVVSYATQVVSGINYVLKIKINSKPDAFIHVKALKKPDGSTEFSGLETDHTEADPIAYFA